MPLQVAGPDIGDEIADITFTTEANERITLGTVRGQLVVVDVFRGHW